MKKLLLLLAAAMILTGCGEGDERRHPLFQKGERAQSAGNGTEAAECFAELLKRRPGSIYVHIKLASVYDELLNQPLSAAYHYRQYLLLMPEAPDAEEVRSWLEVCEKRCYEELKKRFEVSAEVPAEEKPLTAESKPAPVAPSASPADNTAPTNADKTPEPDPALEAAQKEIAELKSLLEQYRSRHQLLQQELEKLRRLNAAHQPAQPAGSPAAAGSEKPNTVYRIQPGDTPGKIARKVYGKSSLYTIILQANPGLDERKLRPGMTIKLPPLPANR